MKKNNFRQHLFEVAVVILTVKNVLEASTLIKRPEVIDILLIISFFFAIAWKLVLQTYTMNRIFLFAVGGILCAYTCIKGNYFFVIYSFLIIIGIQSVDLKEAVYKTAKVKIVLLLIHMSAYFSFMLISPEKINFVYRNGIQRYDFMLGHPNTCSMYVLWASLEIIYAKHEKLRSSYLLLIWLMNAITYYFTNSNTCISVATLTIILLVLEKQKKGKFNLYITRVSRYGFAVCTIMLPLILVSYTKLPSNLRNVFYTIDHFFTGRLLYGAYAFDNYGFSLFGRTITFAEKSYWKGHWLDTIIFDNSFIWMFILYGYFYLLIISVAFFVISNKTTTVEKILIISYTMYGIMEAYIINGAICFPLLFIGKYLYTAIQERREVKVIGKYGSISIGRSDVLERDI